MEEIYEKYYNRVFNMIFSKVSNYTVAEDLTSKVFVKVLNKYDQFDSSKAAVSTWVYTIANNTVIDYFRTHKTYEDIEEMEYISETDIEKEIIDQEELEELADALLKIQERERDIIILHYYSDMNLKDIALKMDMSYSNVKKIHSKALLKLQTIMSHE